MISINTQAALIRALAVEAAEAGDLLQVELCQLAIFQGVDTATTASLAAQSRRHLAEHYGVGRDGATQDVTAGARAEAACLRTLDFTAGELED